MLIDTWTLDPGDVDGVFVELGDVEGYAEAGAVLSDDEAYRYLLWRVWDADRPTLTYVMCNPSVGRGTANDRTLTRCDSFARAWGYGSMVVGNLFARRTPTPEKVAECADPVGPENDRFLEAIADEADTVVAAWGGIGGQFDRVGDVVALLDGDLYALRENADGTPQHPLYAKRDAELTRWHHE